MSISFTSEYNQKAMTAMARALRKTVRKEKSRRSHLFGWFVVALALLLCCWSADNGFSVKLEMRTILSALAALALVAALIGEDALNGYFARRRLLPGTEKASTVFEESQFTSRTEIGTSTFYYDKIECIAESADYFVFVFSTSHAQVYDKKSIRGGTLQEFRDFIERATGKHIVKV